MTARSKETWRYLASDPATPTSICCLVCGYYYRHIIKALASNKQPLSWRIRTYATHVLTVNRYAVLCDKYRLEFQDKNGRHLGKMLYRAKILEFQTKLVDFSRTTDGTKPVDSFAAHAEQTTLGFRAFLTSILG